LAAVALYLAAAVGTAKTHAALVEEIAHSSPALYDGCCCSNKCYPGQAEGLVMGVEKEEEEE